jgi:phage terminase large subunit
MDELQPKKKFNLHPAQIEIVKDTHRFRVINAGRRFGKMLDLKTLVPTPSGWTTIENIHPGDTVFGDDGLPTNVLWESKVFKDMDTYSMQFSDGTNVVAGAEHLWTLHQKQYRKAVSRAKNPVIKPLTITTKDMFDIGVLCPRNDGRVEYNFAVPVCKAVEYKEKKYIIPPYVFGAWLGDGTHTSGHFTQHPNDIQVVDEIRKLGYDVSKIDTKKETAFYIKKIVTQLREIGVYGNKHIPINYLQGSKKQRLELIQGLLDTDGTCSVNGHVEFCNTNEDIAYGLYELVCSLGIKATIKQSDAKLYGIITSKKWRICFSTTQKVFKLKRKLDRLPKKLKSDTGYRYITKIEKIDCVPSKCISVDNKSKLFLITKSFIATHNSTLVAWEMFAMAISNDNARIPYYAPTRDDARDIMWKVLKDICAPLLYGEPNESRLEITVRNKFGTTSQIILYGWEAVQERGKGVGVKNNHIYFDEVAKFKNFAYGWEEILGPTLLDLKGGATFISTPNGFNHFYDLSLKPGDPKVGQDWKYFHFTSYDNPFIDADELQKKKDEISDDRFCQEYLGEFRKKEGLVYKDFSRDKHVISEVPEDLEVLYTLGGLDWGHNHPCAVITIKKDYDGIYWIVDEFYKTGLTEEDIIDYTVSAKFNKVYPDPENASGCAGLKKRGVNVKEVRKVSGSVVSGISKVSEMLKQGRIKVLSSCINVIQEFESYSYPEEKGKTIVEKPLKEGDDAMDAIRYVIMSDFDSPRGGAPVATYGRGKPFGTRINLNKIR